MADQIYTHETPRPIYDGHLRLEVFSRGKLVDVVEGKNVVTNQGRVEILKIIGGVSPAVAITQMAVGDGGCGPPNPPATSALLTPIPFDATATGLRTSINYAVNIQPSPAVNTVAKTITFEAIFNSSSVPSGNFHFTPRVINEIGLRTGASVFIALRAFRSIPFDPVDAMEVKATWVIGII